MVRKDDLSVVQALIAHDDRMTRQFFFKDCRPLFQSIIRHVFSYEVNYDEFVNEFYLYLMEDDASKLRQFEGRSSIYQWLKVTAIRYFIAKRDRMIDENSKEAPVIYDNEENMEEPLLVRMDTDCILNMLPNKRYEYVIRRLILEEIDPKTVAAELEVSVDNLYNIKRRAMNALTKIVLKRVLRYENRFGK